MLQDVLIPLPHNSPNAGNKEKEAALGTETQMPETQEEAVPEDLTPEDAPQKSVEQEQAPDKYAGLSQEEIDVQESYDIIEQEEEEAQKQKDQEEQAAQQEKDAAAENIPIVDDRHSTQAGRQTVETANQTGDSNVVMENQGSESKAQSPKNVKGTKKSTKRKTDTKSVSPTKRSRRIQERKEHKSQKEKESNKNTD